MNLPEIPHGWNELTWQQLVGVWQILLDCSQGKQDVECYARVYQFLARVRFRMPSVNELPENGDSNNMYIIERLDKSRETFLVDVRELQVRLMGWHVEIEGVKEDCEGILEWLDKRQGLTHLPKEFIRIGWRKYFLPSPMMTSLTYQQYGNIQKILQAFWKTEKTLLQYFEQLEEKRNDSQSGFFGQAEMVWLAKDVKTIEDNIKKLIGHQKELRNRFLAHILNSRRFRLTSLANGGTNLSIGWVYTYKVEDAEAQAQQMNRASDVLFHILLQWFQSCMNYYSEQMPDLFSNADGTDIRSPLMSEIDTVNSIMKWKGAYTTQQEVYDANAIFILGDLKDMTKEAKEIEKAQARMKSKR